MMRQYEASRGLRMNRNRRVEEDQFRGANFSEYLLPNREVLLSVIFLCQVSQFGTQLYPRIDFIIK